jgi:hypothetical protein
VPSSATLIIQARDIKNWPFSYSSGLTASEYITSPILLLITLREIGDNFKNSGSLESSVINSKAGLLIIFSILVIRGSSKVSEGVGRAENFLKTMALSLVN